MFSLSLPQKTNSLTTDLGLPYDYASIMHYGPNAFSRGTGPTIVPRQSGVYIGQRKGLSDVSTGRHEENTRTG